MKKPIYNRQDRFWINHYYNNMQLYSSKPLFICFYERDKFIQKLHKDLQKFFEPINKNFYQYIIEILKRLFVITIAPLLFLISVLTMFISAFLWLFTGKGILDNVCNGIVSEIDKFLK